MAERQIVHQDPSVEDVLQSEIDEYGEKGYQLQRLSQTAAHLVRPRMHSSVVAIGSLALGLASAALVYMLWFLAEQEKEMDLEAEPSVTVTASGDLPPE